MPENARQNLQKRFSRSNRVQGHMEEKRFLEPSMRFLGYFTALRPVCPIFKLEYARKNFSVAGSPDFAITASSSLLIARASSS
jgi:hypothetical protein